METKAVTKTRNAWPLLFENTGWFDKFFNTPVDEYFNAGRVMNVPAVNVTEAHDVYGLTMAAPGLEKENIKIEVKDGMMTIRAEKEKEEKEEKDGRFNRREYNYASWSRSFTLPENCNENKIAAEYRNGELKIRIPKTEVKTPEQGKTISIS